MRPFALQQLLTGSLGSSHLGSGGDSSCFVRIAIKVNNLHRARPYSLPPSLSPAWEWTWMQTVAVSLSLSSRSLKGTILYHPASKSLQEILMQRALGTAAWTVLGAPNMLLPIMSVHLLC